LQNFYHGIITWLLAECDEEEWQDEIDEQEFGEQNQVQF
jgi:hypothetical protein